MHHHLAVMRLLDKVVQHLLGLLEVGDHTVLHRLDRHDVARRAAEHLLGLLADCFDLIRVLVDRDDRRFVDDNPFAVREDKCVGGSQVDRKIARKQAEQRPHVADAGVPRLKRIRRHELGNVPEGGCVQCKPPRPRRLRRTNQAKDVGQSTPMELDAGGPSLRPKALLLVLWTLTSGAGSLVSRKK